jgi:hypothetical protein
VLFQNQPCLRKNARADLVFADAAKVASLWQIATVNAAVKRISFEKREDFPGAHAKRHETFEFVAFIDAFSIGLDSH